MACITEPATGYPGYKGVMPFENGMLLEMPVGHGYGTYRREAADPTSPWRPGSPGLTPRRTPLRWLAVDALEDAPPLTPSESTQVA